MQDLHQYRGLGDALRLAQVLHKKSLACERATSGYQRIRFFMPEPLILRDYRTPGQPLQPLPLKIPGNSVDLLKAWADRMQCTPSALGRNLLLQGLEQLQQSHGDAQMP